MYIRTKITLIVSFFLLLLILSFIVVSAQVGSNVALSGIEIKKQNGDILSLSPSFSPLENTPYTLAVDYNIDTISVTPMIPTTSLRVSVKSVTADEIEINITEGSYSILLSPGATKTIDITVEKTNLMGNTTDIRLYTLNVTRVSLSDLNVTGGSLDQTFTADITDYQMAVDYDVESITVTPNVTSSSLSISVGGDSVTSGASYSVLLDPGATTTVTVTVSLGITSRTYTINVTRVSLSGLSVTGGSLDPSFVATTLEYGVAVSYDVGNITVTPNVTSSSLSISVTGGTLTNGTEDTYSVSLNPGATTTATVTVTGLAGFSRTYTLHVTRVSLNGLQVTANGVDISSLLSFSPTTTTYTLAVDYDVESITVTPNVTSSSLSISVEVDGTTMSDTGDPYLVSLNPGETKTVTVRVTEPGGLFQDYTLHVTRVSLSGLSVTGGNLDQTFAADITDYQVAVDYDVESITVTPNVTSSSLSISVEVDRTSRSGIEGSYSVSINLGAATTVTVTVSLGITSRTYTITVERVNQAPSASFTANPNSGESPLAIVFNATANDLDGSIVSYEWDFGNRQSDSGVNVSHTFTTETTTTYTVTLTVTDNDGATSTCAQDVTVISSLSENQPPTAQFITEPNTGELPLTVEFDAENSSDSDGSIVSYDWNFGDGVTASGVSATHTYSTAGTYTVILTVTDNDGEIGTYTDLVTVNQTQTTQMPFNAAVRWGPIKIFNGYVDDLSIEGNTGVGSVSYDCGTSTEGTYIYALDTSNGKLIGDAKISGVVGEIDICERYVFVWIKDGINIYDLNKKFALAQTIPNKPPEWIMNFGNFLYLEVRNAPDYLIDKRTLKKKDLNISDDNHIYKLLLYPDCLIGNPSAFKGGNQSEPVVYNLKEDKVLGQLPSEYLFSHIFAWDPKNNLFFGTNRDKVLVYDLSKGKLISEIVLTNSETYSIVADSLDNPMHYFGIGERLRVIPDFPPSENGFYFLNGNENAYVIDSSGQVKCRIKDSEILGEFKGDTFFKKGDLIGSNRNVCNTSWTKERPKEPFYGRGPYFTDDSIVWLCDSSGLKDHGDVIYQWNYEAGSFLNYTEFTGYEVEILSSEPLILAMRSEKEGVNADWYLVCYNPSKLPFNLIPDFSVNYSPDDVYSAATDVKFICTVKNIPAEAQSNNISYEWDFGDGRKGTGKEVTHRFEKDGTYNVSVSVRLGESVDSSTKSMKLAVLESPDIELTATPRYLTGKGITYVLECKIGKFNDFWDTEWDFRDGQKSKGGLVVSHTYKPGNYTATVTLYNFDETLSWQKEIAIVSKFPDFSTSASPLEGNTALNVDFKCDLLSQNLTDSGLKYQWKIGTEVISEQKSFSNVFIEPGTYVIKLEVRDPASELVTEQSLNITVNPIVLTFSDEGRILHSSAPIFLDTKFIEKYDVDKDGINQFWENEAMEYINPKFDLDEGEKWFNYPEHHVVNFVRVFPYTKAGHRYILFMYCVTWSQDYGRTDAGFYEHNGDVERVIMAWEVIGEDGQNLQLKRVFTSAHGGENDHSAVWDAWDRDCFTRGIAYWPLTEEMCGQLVFEENILKLQVSEDKHAIYPTFDCCEDVTLAYLVAVNAFVMEDCGEGRENPWSFECYNVGEPNHYLIDDLDNPSSWKGLSEEKRTSLTNLFPQEQVWSGRKQHTNSFCGGLAYDEDSPGPIGDKLRNLPDMLTDKL